jgi:predicted hydrocarbon binding protein
MMEESIKARFKEFLKNLQMPQDGRMTSVGQRVAVKDLVSVVQMLRYSAENMSESTIGVVLTRIGTLIASKEFESVKGSGKEAANSCFENLSIKGWGVFAANPEATGGEVVLRNSAIAQEYAVKALKVDYIAVGMIAKIYEKAFNRKYLVRELKCIANGDNECKFAVKPL